MIAFLKHASPQTRKIFNETSLIPSVLVHDVEQGFCFTYNNLQGATIDRLIIVLYDLSNCKLGKLCLHKLYVALSRVRKGRHLAVFNVSKRELQYLKKLRYSEKLLAWDSNYNNEGICKTDTTIFFNDVERLFDQIHKKGGLEKANKTLLIDTCKKLYIFYKGRKEYELRNNLKELYNQYIERINN